MGWFEGSSEGGGSAPTEIGDHRWEGYSNADLANVVTQLGEGRGANAMSDAAQALGDLAKALAETDQTLRDELGKIGVAWQSNASDVASVIMSDSAQFGGDAGKHAGKSSDAVSQQADVYSNARNSSPEAATLLGDTETNFVDGAAGLVGHETDHAREVRETNAARQGAIDAMNRYTEASRSNIASYQPLPKPPGMELHSQPVDGTTTAQSVGSSSAAVPAVGGAGTAAPSGGGAPTAGGVGVPVAGGGATGSVPGGPRVPGAFTGTGPLGGLGGAPGAGVLAGGGGLRPDMGMAAGAIAAG
ncbi:MAG: PPE domain-containing protein, partial [Pseudonocardiaceae bacterium]|nr:PPE domain-containing protein [Pseudonocardiaceae bacterium]